jgi:hypothetical protein
MKGDGKMAKKPVKPDKTFNQRKKGGDIVPTATAHTGEEISNGMFLCGTVVGRRRAYVGESQRELVTYKVMANDNIYFLKVWCRDTSSGYFSVGEIIKVPVLVSVDEYKGRHSVSITLRDGDTGEF